MRAKRGRVACPRPHSWQWLPWDLSPGHLAPEAVTVTQNRIGRCGPPVSRCMCQGADVLRAVLWLWCWWLLSALVTVSSVLTLALSLHPILCPSSRLHDMSLFFRLRSQTCLPPGADAPGTHEGISRQTRAPGPPRKRWASRPGRPHGGARTARAGRSGRALWTSRSQR